MRYRTRIYALLILATLCLALPMTGCVSAEVNRSARDLIMDLDVLERATVPDPRYNAEGRVKVARLREAVRAHAAAIEAATR